MKEFNVKVNIKFKRTSGKEFTIEQIMEHIHDLETGFNLRRPDKIRISVLEGEEHKNTNTFFSVGPKNN